MKKRLFILAIACVAFSSSAVDHVWTAATGGDLFDAANWAAEEDFTLNGQYANLFLTNGPLQSKTLTITGAVSIASLDIDATLGDGSPVVFQPVGNGAFNIDFQRLIRARGTVEWRDKLRSWADITLDGGEHILHDSTDYYTGSFPNSNPRFHLVNGAKVVYDGATHPQPTGMPEGAWMYLDASRPETLQTVTGDDGVDYVERWNDVRGVDYPYAVAPSALCRPAYRRDAAGGRYLDFGPLVFGTPENGAGRALNWSAANGEIRTVFMVFSDVRTSQYAQSIICRANGGHRLSFHRGDGGPTKGGTRLYTVASEAWTSGCTIYDGRVVTGGDVPVVPADSFHVVCTASDTGLLGEAFARDGNTHGGGIRIAECVVYNRRLTEDECDEAFAHLAAKWQGKSYKNYRAGNNGPFGVIRADSGTTLEARAEVVAEKIEAAGVSGFENNTLNLSSTGGVTVAKISAGTVNFAGCAFTVKGLDGAETPIPTPLAHWDASDTNTMELVEVNGSSCVNRWFPVDGKLKDGTFQAYACSPTQRPRLARAPELAHAFLDFGLLDTSAEKTNAACLLFSSALKATVKSVVMVVADPDDDDRAGFLGNDTSYSYIASYCRGTLGTLFNPEQAHNAASSRLGLNGWPTSNDRVFPGGFNILSQTFACSIPYINAFCTDRGGWYGGLRYAEVLLFDCELSEGQIRALENRLAKKWFNRGVGAVERTVGDYVPATNAWLHVDASAAASLTLGENNEVIQWRDRNGNGRFCAPPSYARRPVLVNDGTTSYVDMGLLKFETSGAYPTASHLLMSETNTHCYTAFVVHRDADSGFDQNVIGSCDFTSSPMFCRGGDKKVLNGSVAKWMVVRGGHYLDGVPCDFTETPLPAGFHVLCFEKIKTDRQNAAPIRVDCFGADYKSGHAGGQRLAECIIYDRRLNPLERDETMAYLMNKYRRTAAADESHIKTFNASHAQATRFSVSGGRGLSIGTLNAPNGIVKSGAGVLAVGTTTARALEMDDGTLVCESTLALDSLAANGGTVEGCLQLGDGAVVTTTLGDASQGCVTVKGAVSVAGTIAVDVDASGLTRTVVEERPLIACTSVTGSTDWRVSVSGGCVNGRVVRTSNGIALRYSPRGTLLLLK